ncbi:glycosyltransferase [Maribacter sp. Asnod1-A12]|uniref:glycosyltransferase n=1 Tax=Maribacter sp. Asnod1-A12 TaxID=3160576 RepID=UPI00386EBADB
MRVLHIFYELKFSGAEIMYANAASHFQEKGVDLMALSTAENIGEFLPQFEAESIKVLHKPLSSNEFNPFVVIPYFTWIYKVLKNNNIDVLHIHRSKHIFLFSLTTYLAGKKAVSTVHNNYKHRKWTWIKGFLERYVSSKVLNLKMQSIGQSVYENELNYYKNDTILVPNWYDDERFYPQNSEKEKEEMRIKLNISNSSFVIISTGGCSDVKNHHDIIRALSIVNKEIDCIYLHLGKGVTTDEEIELSKSLGINSQILFLGNQSNVRDYLIASDAYIMSSRFEGLAIAAIEAMACAKPSILYNVKGLKDLIHDDDNGFLISENYNELAGKILYLQKNDKTSDEMAQNALSFVRKNFSIQNGVNGIMKIYNS